MSELHSVHSHSFINSRHGGEQFTKALVFLGLACYKLFLVYIQFHKRHAGAGAFVFVQRCNLRYRSLQMETGCRQMRNYQRKKKNPYLLPHNVYMQTLYLIRDYERLKDEYNQLLYASSMPCDGQPKGSGGVGRPAENKAVILSGISTKTDAVENALKQIPECYRKGVWNNVLYGWRYPIDADERTYRTYKQRFIYAVAKKMLFIT